MEYRCPDCASPEVGENPVDSTETRRCLNCGARFGRESAFVTVAEAEAYAAETCTCDKVRGCPPCFRRADSLVGARIRDSQGREWVVEEVDEKDGFPTIGGARYWDRPDEVEVLEPAKGQIKAG
jgi:hypothetical protein